MKTIFRIARLEWCVLFYSPVSWLVLVIFIIQSGGSFTDHLRAYAQIQDAGYGGNFLTATIFSGHSGVFAAAAGNLYLYIPLLTMGLLSREVSSGSIKLLLSSPVRIREIVLGKFLAMMAYNLLLAGVLLLLLVTGGFTIEHMDYGLLLSGILGIYLLMGAYSAIGLFMSSLTSYQVVAAISTLVVLAGLTFLRQVDQTFEMVRVLTYFLSLAGRTDKFISGLISSQDLSYFLIVMGLFLSLTYLKLKSASESKTLWRRSGRYALVIGLTLLLGYSSSRPELAVYCDTTRGKSQTLSPYSQSILKKINDPVVITAYTNILGGRSEYGSPEKRNNDIDFWEGYRRFLPGMRLRYVNYYDTTDNLYLFKRNAELNTAQVARKVSNAHGLDFKDFLSPAELGKEADLSQEKNNFVRQVAIGNKKTFLRMFNDFMTQPSETEITAAFKRVLEGPAKLDFLIGHHERRIDGLGDKDYKLSFWDLNNRASLINQGFDVDTLSLDNREIPRDLAALVIADPRTPIKPLELEKIKRFIADGGNLLIAGEPGDQVILSPLLQPLGVILGRGVLIQESKDLPPDFVLLNFTDVAHEFTDQYYTTHMDTPRISVSGAAALQYDIHGIFKIKPILLTNGVNTWDKFGTFAMDTGKVTFNPEQGDDRSLLPVALSLTRTVGNKEQRIMVLGDADILSRAGTERRNPHNANAYFLQQIFSWFCYGKFPVNTRGASSLDTRLRITGEDLPFFRAGFLGILPALLVASGMILLIKRKRK